MILHTDRLILRNFNIDDLDDVFEYAKIEEIGLNAGWLPHRNKEDSLNILNMFIKDNLTFAIVYKENKKVIGSISLSKDKMRPGVNCKVLGYVLSKDYHNKGIMTEAVNEILKYGFLMLNLSIISVSHFTDNIASKRVIEKNGFLYEGTMRKSLSIYNGTIKDRCFYSITKEEFIKKIKYPHL